MSDENVERNKPKPSRLGRGLSSLMSQPVPIDSREAVKEVAGDRTPTPVGAASAGQLPAGAEGGGGESEEVGVRGVGGGGLRSVPLDRIVPNRHQPRQSFPEEGLQSLADSIRRDGVMQPVILRPGLNDQYELVAGERRWRAARLAGLAAIPALLRELDEAESAEWALIENLQREDLNPIERAEAIQTMAEQFSLSHDQVAERIGLNRSTVTNLLRLLKLSAEVRQFVRDDLLSMGQARALAGTADDTEQVNLAKRAIREGLSVRQCEEAVRTLGEARGDDRQGTPSQGKPVPRGTSANHLTDLEKQLTEQLSYPVRIRTGRKKNTGTLSIEFSSLDEFDALLQRLGVEAG